MEKKIVAFLNTGCCGLKPLALMIMSLIVSGFLVLLVGFIMILSSSFYVPPKIREYNTQVEIWNKKYMKDFSGNSVSVNISTNDFKRVTDLIPSYNQISNKGYPELHSYSDTYYRFSIWTHQKYSDYYCDLDFTIIAALPKTQGHYLPTVKIRLWVLTKVHGISAEEECFSAVNGFYINGTCYWLYKLVGVCSKIGVIQQNNGRKIFTLSRRYGGYGCQPTRKELKNQISKWNPGQYQIIPRKSINDTLENILHDFNIETSVRSEQDPHLLALNITGGQFTSFYNDASFTMNKIRVIGIIILITGFMVMGCFVLLFFSCCLCKKTRKILVTIGLSEEQQLIYKYKEQEAHFRFQEKYGEEAVKLKKENVKFHLFPEKKNHEDDYNEIE